MTPQWKYDKAHTTQVKLKLNLVTDRDILDRLAAVENKQGYIKELIRRDIMKENIVGLAENAESI